MNTDFSSHLISTMFLFQIKKHLTGTCSADMTPYYMDLDCGNGERNRGGKLACYCVDENSAIYV